MAFHALAGALARCRPARLATPSAEAPGAHALRVVPGPTPALFAAPEGGPVVLLVEDRADALRAAAILRQRAGVPVVWTLDALVATNGTDTLTFPELEELARAADLLVVADEGSRVRLRVLDTVVWPRMEVVPPPLVRSPGPAVAPDGRPRPGVGPRRLLVSAPAGVVWLPGDRVRVLEAAARAREAGVETLLVGHPPGELPGVSVAPWREVLHHADDPSVLAGLDLSLPGSSTAAVAHDLASLTGLPVVSATAGADERVAVVSADARGAELAGSALAAGARGRHPRRDDPLRTPAACAERLVALLPTGATG
jgi:hypothetical protein